MLVVNCIRYPTDLDRTLNEDVLTKIHQYRAEYNNRASHTVSFMTVVPSTMSLLFLKNHQETDHFLVTSGVQLT